MILTGIVTQVQERKTTNAKGLPVTYRDVFISDANPDPMSRFTSEIVIRPTEEENTQWKFAAGVKLSVSLRQILEVRNGLPVVRAVLSAAK